jgi:RimJ/RimL family protein N-acetyltransferase
VKAADYSAGERLRDGRTLEIRALRPADRAGLLASFERTSEESRYRRFFAPKRTFSEREIEFYLNVDFVGHVALVAELEEGGQQVIAGGGRYIVSEPGRAEVAFAVDDLHQGLGIATRLMRHLVVIARAAGQRELFAEVLPDNASMLKVFARCGLAATTRREGGIVHVTMALSAPQAR